MSTFVSIIGCIIDNFGSLKKESVLLSSIINLVTGDSKSSFQSSSSIISLALTGAAEDHVVSIVVIGTAEGHVVPIEIFGTAEGHVVPIEVIGAAEGHAVPIEVIGAAEGHVVPIDVIGAAEGHEVQIDLIGAAEGHVVTIEVIGLELFSMSTTFGSILSGGVEAGGATIDLFTGIAEIV